MAQQTPLDEEHLADGAKMVDFHGWMMPLHHGSQLDEHHQVRRAAGMFDVSHMTIVDLAGPRHRDFLRYLLANDVTKLTVPGQALYAGMLNASGGVIDDLIVYFLSETEFRLVVNSATRDKDVEWIIRHAERYQVVVNVRSVFQDRCRFYAARRRSFPGLRATMLTGVQLRVFPDQRSGCWHRAAW